jgi:tetratricopeptide (TPR) repeat protein
MNRFQLTHVSLAVCFALQSLCAVESVDPQEHECRERLAILGAAVCRCVAETGAMPSRPSALYTGSFVPELSLFSCPASVRPIGEESQIDSQTDYEFPTSIGRQRPHWLVREKRPQHGAQPLAYYSDGSIRKYTGTDVPPATPTQPPVAVAPPTPPITPHPTVMPPPPPPAVVTTTPPPVRPVSSDWPGRELFAAGRYNEALPKCDAFLAANRDHRQARFDRGVMRLWLNNPPGALADFQALAASDPNDIESRRLRALVELMIGKPEAARAEAEALKKMCPQDAQVVLLHAQAAMWTQDAPAALQSLAEVRQLDPGVVARLYDEANRFLKAGVGIAAAQEYVTVLYLDQKQAGAYFGLGFARLLLGQRRLAIDAFQRYLQLDSTSAYAEQVRQQLRQLGQ